MSETTEAAPAATTEPGGLPSLLDHADEAAAPEAAKPSGQRPEWCPEQFWDAAKGEVRTESMAKSWGDFRGRLAKGGLTPPESPDAYKLPAVEGVPEGLVKDDDPLWREVRAEAHKAGLTPAQLEAVAKPYLAAAAKALADKPADDPAAVKAAQEAEIAKLGPQGRQVLAEAGAWLKGLVSRGVLSHEEGQALGAWWCAPQVRALMKLRERMGEKPIPVSALDDGQLTVADARRMMEEGHAKGDMTLVERARKGLRELEAKGVNLLG